MDLLPDNLMTLDEAARLIPGATAATLKRRVREGKLVAYKPSKAYLTTRANLQRMIEACRVQKIVKSSETLPDAIDVELASAALDAALVACKAIKRRR